MGLYILGLAIAGSGRCFFVCISGEGAFANVVQKWDFCAFLHNEQEIRSLYYLFFELYRQNLIFLLSWP